MEAFRPDAGRIGLSERDTEVEQDLEISLFGELQVSRRGERTSLPASKKARALLAFLVTTGRPHRRERLCELFWDLPDDPKAALRWSLSKLRKVVDTPERLRVKGFETAGKCCGLNSMVSPPNAPLLRSETR